ncbi:MAG: metal-dependent hydrolase [Methanobacteriota archaeon]|nr:MAG: metal-dependent hydrolase [Euryarchaeota archaeon]
MIALQAFKKSFPHLQLPKFFTAEIRASHMTWGTTHLGISIILLRMFSPKRVKERYESNRIYFFLASLGAEFPDIDLLIGGHRTWSHSLFFPLGFLLILFSLPDDQIAQRIENWRDKSFYLKLFGILWVTHLMYDTSFGPIALFYPVDQRLYDITGGIVMVLDSTRVGLGGIFIDVRPIDPNIGKNIFFVNWTAEERVAYFGNTRIKFRVLDFMVHSTIFLYWLITVLFPAIKDITERNEKIRNTVQKLKIPKVSLFSGLQFFGRTKYQALILIAIALVAFIAGPSYGEQWSYEDQGDVSFIVLSDTLRLVGSLDFSFPEDAEATFVVSFPQSTINYSVIWGILDSTIRQKIENFTSSLIDEFEQGNRTYPELVSDYKKELNGTVGPIWSVSPAGNAYTFKVEPLDGVGQRTLSIGFALFEWNLTKYFIRSATVNVTYKIPRETEYQTGWVVFSLALIAAAIIVLRKWKQDKNSLKDR